MAKVPFSGRIDSDVYEKLRDVAWAKKSSVAELISQMAQEIVARDWARLMAEEMERVRGQVGSSP